MQRPCHLWSIMCGAAALAGCSDPRAVGPTRTRLDRIDAKLTQFGDREKDGPRRLATRSEQIEKEGYWHDEHLRRDLKRVKTWVESDIQRWNERQPKYRAALKGELDGDLKRAEDTAYQMMY